MKAHKIEKNLPNENYNLILKNDEVRHLLRENLVQSQYVLADLEETENRVEELLFKEHLRQLRIRNIAKERFALFDHLDCLKGQFPFEGVCQGTAAFAVVGRNYLLEFFRELSGWDLLEGFSDVVDLVTECLGLGQEERQR